MAVGKADREGGGRGQRAVVSRSQLGTGRGWGGRTIGSDALEPVGERKARRGGGGGQRGDAGREERGRWDGHGCVGEHVGHNVEAWRATRRPGGRLSGQLGSALPAQLRERRQAKRQEREERTAHAAPNVDLVELRHAAVAAGRRHVAQTDVERVLGWGSGGGAGGQGGRVSLCTPSRSELGTRGRGQGRGEASSSSSHR